MQRDLLIRTVNQLVAAGLLIRDDDGYLRFRQGWLPQTLSYASVPDEHALENRYAIGLTGNIAMGKSTVLKILADLGALIIDADSLVHHMREPGGAAYDPLVALLGAEVLLPDGRIDTRKLADRAFADQDLLRQLGQLFSPLVVAEVQRLITEGGRQVAVVEAIRLLEGGLRTGVDSVWVVDAPREVQIARLVAMRGLTREQAVQRIDAQASQAAKLAQADVVIVNDGDLRTTQTQVVSAWEAVLESLSERGRVSGVLVEAYLNERLVCIDPADARQILRAIARHVERGQRVALDQVSDWLAVDSGQGDIADAV